MKHKPASNTNKDHSQTWRPTADEHAHRGQLYEALTSFTGSDSLTTIATQQLIFTWNRNFMPNYGRMDHLDNNVNDMWEVRERGCHPKHSRKRVRPRAVGTMIEALMGLG